MRPTSAPVPRPVPSPWTKADFVQAVRADWGHGVLADLVAAGCDPNQPLEGTRIRPLQSAILNRAWKTAWKLLQLGADPNPSFPDGRTPLNHVLLAQPPTPWRLAVALVRAGARLNTHHHTLCQQLLRNVFEYGGDADKGSERHRSRLLAVLLARGGPPSTPPGEVNPGLEASVSWGTAQDVQRMVDAGAAVTDNALTQAIKRDLPDKLALLLTAGGVLSTPMKSTLLPRCTAWLLEQTVSAEASKKQTVARRARL